MEKIIKVLAFLLITISCSTRNIYISKIETYSTFYKIYFNEGNKKGFFISNKKKCNYSQVKDSIVSGKKLRIPKYAIWWDDPKAVTYRDDILVWDNKSEYMMYNSEGFCGLNTVKIKKYNFNKKDLKKLLE